jgi:hypothetical protein
VSQRDAGDVASFKSAIASSTVQARAAKSGIIIFANVTTQMASQHSATGQLSFTAQQMAAAAEAIYPSTVNGIWINDPEGHTDVTYAFLELLDRAG